MKVSSVASGYCSNSHTIVATVLSAYIVVWVLIYLLIHRVMNEESRKVLGAPCIIMTVEIVKCVISFILFCSTRTGTGTGSTTIPSISFVQGFKELISFCKSQTCVKMLMLYAPIALLYAVYNNLMLVNLKSHHPTVYLIWSTSRLLMVAYIWQIVFNVKISHKKKMAMFAIVLGIVAKGIFAEHKGMESLFNQQPWELKSAIMGNFLVVCQMACSVTASVYNEKLLKYNDCNQQLQNMCLYINSIAINALFFIATKIMSKYSSSDPIPNNNTDSAIFTPSVSGRFDLIPRRVTPLFQKVREGGMV